MSVRDRASPKCCVACALSSVSDFQLDSEPGTFVCVNFKIVFTAFLGRCNFKVASGCANFAPQDARTGDMQAGLGKKKKKMANEDIGSEFDPTVYEIKLKKEEAGDSPLLPTFLAS